MSRHGGVGHPGTLSDEVSQHPLGTLALWGAGFGAAAGVAVAGSVHQVMHLLAGVVLQSSRAAAADQWLAAWSAFPAWGVVTALAAPVLCAAMASGVALKRLSRRGAIGTTVALLVSLGVAAWLWSPSSWVAVVLAHGAAAVSAAWLSAHLARWAAETGDGARNWEQQVHAAPEAQPVPSAQPAHPGQPAQLARPVQPAHSTRPAHPAHAAQHSQPAQPVQPAQAAQAPAQAAQAAQAVVLNVALAIAAVWAVASVVPGLVEGAAVRWLELAATAGVGVSLACGFLYLSGIRQLHAKAQFEAAGVEVSPGYRLALPRPAVLVMAGAVLVALLLPSDISPLHVRDFNRWMESFTDFVGPYLVPSARVRRVDARDGAIGRIAEYVSSMLDPGAGGPGSRRRLRMLIQLVLLSLVAFGVWRIFRRDKKTLRPGRSLHKMPLGIGWLLAEIKRAVKRLLAWIGIDTGFVGNRAGDSGSFAASTGMLRPRSRLKRLPADVVRIYLHVLEWLGQKGLPRMASETPLEYLARWERRSDERDPGALPALTHLFLDARYGVREPAPGAVQRARRAASLTLRSWRRVSWARRFRSWFGRRRDDGDESGRGPW